MDSAVKEYGIASLSLCGAIAAWFAAARTLEVLKSQLCPSDGFAALICDRSLATNLMWATRVDWVLFALVGGTVYLVVRLWLAPWVENRGLKAAAT